MLGEASLRHHELEHFARPMPANEYRRLHHHPRAAYDKEWRQAFWALAKKARVPPMPAGIMVQVLQPCRPGTSLPDTMASASAVKAAIDGIVDAGVIPDDGPTYVKAVVFVAPYHGERDALILLLEEAD